RQLLSGRAKKNDKNTILKLHCWLLKLTTSPKNTAAMVWACNKCDKDFFSERSLDQHLEDSGNHNYCFSCNKDFSSPYALDQHLEYSSAHTPAHKLWRCEKCNKG